MRHLRSKLALAGTALGVGALLLASPASASTGSGTVVGSGTITPGLSTNPTAQSVTFSGTLVVAGTTGTGVYSCTFNGSSTILETVAQGEGNASGSCSGAGTISATVHYLRAGGDVVLTGSASGAVSGSIAGDCSFEPTNANPVKNYQLQCEITIH